MLRFSPTKLTGMIRLLLVDDQDLIRRGMKALLKTDESLLVVGEAENGERSLDLVASLQPDVVLMDVRMPVMDGVAATQAICQRFPETKVLILTTFGDETLVTQALQVGAAGYLLKDTPFEDLTQAIRLVHKGYTQIAPGLVNKVMAQPAMVQLTQTITAQSLSPDSPLLDLATLTPREREILDLIAQGASNREIAEALFIAEKTVRNHVTNILSRLGLRDRTQAAIMALQRLN